MKPKHYIDTYYRDGKFEAGKAFYDDLMLDFSTLLKEQKGHERIKGFENCIRPIRMKWDSINNKCGGQLTEKAWSYFYAKYIASLRDQLFPEEMERRRKEKEDRRKFWEEKRRFEDEQSTFWFEYILQGMYRRLDKAAAWVQFKRLGLEPTATVSDVKAAFREKIKEAHPDKGGSDEQAHILIEAKNICLQYLNKAS